MNEPSDADRKRLAARFAAWVEGRGAYALLGALLLATILVHLPLRNGTFSMVDDWKQFLGNETMHSLTFENFREVAFTNFLRRNHNPMYTSFLLNWAATPGSYAGFAAFNLAWFLVTVVIYYFFAGLFLPRRSLRLLAAALFSVHSARTDIVAWISSRCHLMGMTFLLLAFLAWRSYLEAPGRARRAAFYLAALLCAWLAIWNKNIFLTTGLLLLVYDFYRRRRLSPALLLDKIPFFALAAVPIVILQTSGTSYRLDFTARAVGGSLGATLVTDVNLLVQYLFHLVVPWSTFVWVEVFPVESLTETSLGAGVYAMRLPPLAGLAVLAGLTLAAVVGAVRCKARLPLFFLLFFAVAMAPVMNIPPHWVEFAFRYDWIPLSFFCVTLVAGVSALWRAGGASRRAAVGCAFAVLLAWHAGETFSQCARWHSQEELTRVCVETFPDALPCRNLYAYYLERRGDLKGALRQLKVADNLLSMKRAVRHIQVGTRMARIYERLHKRDKSAFYYERALLRDSLTPAERKRIQNKLAAWAKKKGHGARRPAR